MSSNLYILNIGENGVEDERLNYQHTYLFKPLAGKVFPDVITEHLSSLPSPHVADIATGTGIWLRDLVGELPPSSKLDGYDFDVTKFPLAETLPKNVTLQFGNLLEPFPSELHGTYDVVHVRFLMYALKTVEWIPVAMNVMTLLKPGGWLLWEESGYYSWFCFPMSKAWNEFVDIEIRTGYAWGRDPETPLHLFRYIQEAGYTDCDEKLFNSISVPHIQCNMSRAAQAISTQVLNGLVKKGGIDGMRTKEDSEKLQAAIAEDFKTCKPSIGMAWVWGRKPMS
jgi:ubiquinone/menaquinone biosynthesis C-methylase UbiE